MRFTSQLIQSVLILLACTLIPSLGAQESGEGGAPYLRIQELYDQGEYDASLELLEAMPEDDARTAYWNGLNQLQLGDPALSVQSLEKAVSLDEQPDYLVALSASYGAMIPEAGLLDKGRLAKKSLHAIERALELNPDHFDARIALMLYCENAPSFMEGGIKKALAQAKEACRIDPVRGGIALGRLYFRQGDYLKARIEFERADEAGVNKPEPGYWILSVMLASKDYSTWMTQYERYHAKFPDALGAKYQLGKYAALTEHEEKAGIEALKEYLLADEDILYPDHASAHWRMGMIYENMGNDSDAIAQYRQALTLDPNNEVYTKALNKLVGRGK